MNIRDMPIGSILKFGSFSPGINGEGVEPHEILWRKASQNGDFITRTCEDYLTFDAQEPSSPNQHRCANGNSCYPHSNIHQFLNSSDRSWYSASHECDAPPSPQRCLRSYVSRPGFLSRFEKWEIDMLISREVVCAIPSGSRKQLGDSVTINCKVSLPSASEVGISIGVNEGELLEYFEQADRASQIPSQIRDRAFRNIPRALYKDGYWLRTPCITSDCSVYYVRGDSGDIEQDRPKTPRGIRPVIRISLDNETTIDDAGVYSVIAPDATDVDESEFLNILCGK